MTHTNQTPKRQRCNGFHQRLTGILLMASISISLCVSPHFTTRALAQGFDRELSLEALIQVPGGSKLTSVDADQESIRNILLKLSRQGGFNLLMDDSVKGNVSLSLSKVSINEALQSISTLTGITVLPRSGNIYLAISNQAALEKGLSRQLSKVIKIHYSNAQRIASVLNSSIFSKGSTTTGSNNASSNTNGTGNSPQKASADARTNSVVVVGTQREIELAEEAITQLDQARQSKTFYLSHSNALDVATLLTSSIFNDGTNLLGLTSTGNTNNTKTGSGNTSGTGSSITPSVLRVEQENIQEGQGVNSLSNGSGGSSSSGSSDSSSSSSSGSTGGSTGNTGATLSQNIVLRGSVKSSQTVQISPEGPIVLPDTRTNAVTVFGTAEQIALAERVMPTLDAQLPQVAIEAALVEISEDGLKTLSNQFGLADGRLQGGFNNQSLPLNVPVPGLAATAQPVGTGLIGLPTLLATDPQSLARTGLGFSTKPLNQTADYLMQIQALVRQSKAKVLANPTVVATHDTEAVISIVDEIVRTVVNQLDAATGTLTVTNQIGEAGIVLDILPKVGEDGTINMRIRPSISSIRAVVTDSFGNSTTLLSKRDVLAQQVRIRDGQTLLLGGLIQQTEQLRQDKLPGLGDLPIAGALFRSSSNTGKRSEIMMMITPHILNKTQLTPVSNVTRNGGAE